MSEQNDPAVVRREYETDEGLVGRQVVANFMLYHVKDVDGAVSELARVAPRLVAATNGAQQLAELWELVGRDLSERGRLFFCETGEEHLRRRYADVQCIDASGTIDLSADDMRRYIEHSIAHKHLAARVPAFDGVQAVTAASCVFVATRP